VVMTTKVVTIEMMTVEIKKKNKEGMASMK